MSSSSSHATITYTSISSYNDVPSWGIPLMDAYESDPEAPEAAPQSPDQAPLSPAQAPVQYLHLYHYSAEFEPVKEDPEEDPEEEPSKKEEKLLAPADSPLAELYIDLPSEVEEDEVAAPTPPLPPPSLLSPLLSPLPRIPSPPLLLPPPTRRAAAAARQPRSTLARGTDYGFVTGLEEVNERVTDLAASHRHDSGEFHDEGDRWSRAIGHIQELEHSREPERRDRPSDAGISC
ncbi:hypothetical protein Tco_0009176 [Tanacetum coccineum]